MIEIIFMKYILYGPVILMGSNPVINTNAINIPYDCYNIFFIKNCVFSQLEEMYNIIIN